MADSTTTTYSFTLPEVGASADSWGTKLNANWSKVDDLFDGTVAVTGINLTTFKVDSVIVTASAAELNKLDGLTATTTELNFVDGVTSNIQTQLDSMVEKAGDTMTGDLSFGDGVKAKFGASDDLQIYHDGSNSFIKDTGDGILFVQGSGGVRVLGADTSESLARFNENGSVQLYHDNAEKLATTATGVDVTGTVTADAVSVTQTGSTTALRAEKSQTGQIIVAYNGASVNYLDADTQYFRKGDGTKLGEFSGGDFHLYEDTGTTAKFHWDASAERLGIGTSPAEALHVYSAISNINALIESGDANAYLAFKDNATTNSASVFLGASGDNMTFHAGGASERMRIDSNGRLGIGSTAPTADLHIKGTNAELDIENNTGRRFRIQSTTANSLSFIDKTANSERARIDSSGNLLVGTTVGSLYNTSSNTGVQIDGTNANISIARSGGRPIDLNRLGTDGEIAQFRKNGSTVGSIGVTGGDCYIATGTSGIRFVDSNNSIAAVDNTGSGRDALTDLGNSGTRFKDLYLSGGVYLGGTGSANKLDDYEEGSWSTTVTTHNLSALNTTVSGVYTKVGNLVTISGKIQSITASTGLRYVTLSLPFSQSTASIINTGTCTNYPKGNNHSGIVIDNSGGETNSWYIAWNNSSAQTSTHNVRFQITYQTNA